MRILTTILLLSVLGHFTGQTIILSEDFNDGFPAGWQLVDEDGVTPYNSSAVNFITDAYVITEDYDSIGVMDSILVATSWLDSTVEARDYLILPKLSLGSYGNYLSFDAKSLDASYPDGLEIRISSGGVGLWEFFLTDPAYSNVAMDPEWNNYKISLDSAGVTGQDVFITFFHVCTDKYILALDNIQVSIEDPVGIEEPSNEISLYPNPTSGMVNLNLKESTPYKIIDVSGRIVEIGQINNSKIDLVNLDNGIYWIIVENYKPIQIIKE